MKSGQMTSTVGLFFFIHGRGQLKRLSKSNWESPKNSFSEVRISSRILSETLEPGLGILYCMKPCNRVLFPVFTGPVL